MSWRFERTPLFTKKLARGSWITTYLRGWTGRWVTRVAPSYPVTRPAGHPGRVVLRTPLGARRVVDMLVGEQLPRIC